MTRKQSLSGLTADEALGMTINQVMFHHGVTRAELARRIGMSGPSVSMKLRGQVGWSLADLYSTAQALGVAVEDLMPIQLEGVGFAPAPYVPGSVASQTKNPAPSGTGPSLVAGTGFEPATSGL